MANLDFNSALDIAIMAAIRGGRIINQFWGELNSTQIFEKSSWRDIVTIADKESERVVLETIKSAFPSHFIISEEGGGVNAEHKNNNLLPAEQEWAWAIDPLDGTTNFRHSYPFFCVSIGLLNYGKPVLGVVFNPIQNELFTAIKGFGAFLNGRRLKVSKVNTLRESLLVTGFAYSANRTQERSMQLFHKLNFLTHGVRRDGSAALDLCFVAAGRIEAFWEYGLNIWDVAAGSLIVEEAGGNACELTNTEKEIDLFAGEILATNNLIKTELLTQIKDK
jgi:myo-inositol-1(or 4)-monophosphatase